MGRDELSRRDAREVSLQQALSVNPLSMTLRIFRRHILMSTLDPHDRTRMSVEDIYHELKARLGDYTPDFELRVKAELAYEINQLKVQRNAVILGHNYMEPALFHSVPDFVGDSLDLSRKAATTDKDVIVFCGVKFMAETAKILNPTRTVLIPSLKAGCSLAESITAADVRALQGALSRRAGGDLCQHLRRCQGRERHLLHLGQRGRGGGVAGHRHGDLPARRVPGRQRRPRDRQAHHLPDAAARRQDRRPTPKWTTR